MRNHPYFLQGHPRVCPVCGQHVLERGPKEKKGINPDDDAFLIALENSKFKAGTERAVSKFFLKRKRLQPGPTRAAFKSPLTQARVAT